MPSPSRPPQSLHVPLASLSKETLSPPPGSSDVTGHATGQGVVVLLLFVCLLFIIATFCWYRRVLCAKSDAMGSSDNMEASNTGIELGGQKPPQGSPSATVRCWSPGSRSSKRRRPPRERQSPGHDGARRVGRSLSFGCIMDEQTDTHPMDVSHDSPPERKVDRSWTSQGSKSAPWSAPGRSVQRNKYVSPQKPVDEEREEHDVGEERVRTEVESRALWAEC